MQQWGGPRMGSPEAAASQAQENANNLAVLQRASRLLALPVECLETVLLLCGDAETLVAVNETCSTLHAFDGRAGLRLVEKVARAIVQAASHPGQDGRWRRRSWLARLHIEDSAVGFANFQWGTLAQPPSELAPQYRFLPPSAPDAFLHVRLDGMGPKLLVSDLSTADQPLLRWRLAVRGNTAVEFGVVSMCLVNDDKALHKCQQEERKFEKLQGKLLDEQRPTGFCSSITVGSMLPFKTAIMKGSVVELLARRGRLEILVQHPPDGQELYWHNTRTIPKPYKGPLEVRFEQDFSPDHDIKLALTSWAHGAFDVLHPAPGSRMLGPGSARDWDRMQRGSGGGCSRQPGQQQQQRQQQEQVGRQAPAATAAPVATATAAAAAAVAAQPTQLPLPPQQQQQALLQPQEEQQQALPPSPSSTESASSEHAMQQ